MEEYIFSNFINENSHLTSRELYNSWKQFKTSESYEMAKKLYICQNNGLELANYSTFNYEMCEVAINNNPLILEYIESRREFLSEIELDNLRKIAITNNWNVFKFIPEEERTEELCGIAIQSDCKNLQYIPANLQTIEMCEDAISRMAGCIQWVANKTEYLCKLSLDLDPWCITVIPELTEELCLYAVSKLGIVIRSIPDEFKTENVCRTALLNTKGAFEYLPEQFRRNSELCEIAVLNKPENLSFVSCDELKENLLNSLIGICGMNICYCQNLTNEKVLNAVSINGLSLKFVPEELKTVEIITVACSQNGLALEFVPDEYKTPELEKLCVDNNIEALKFTR